jgi:SAM-dependent methyltransferase
VTHLSRKFNASTILPAMIFERLRMNLDLTDDDFNLIYPDQIRILSRKHWTSVAVAKAASDFLVKRPGTRVLDIGSGAGKFCLVGAANTDGHFTGVEQRAELASLSQELAVQHQIPNAHFIHGNITSVNFRDYDAFYFYNSFYEQLEIESAIDHTIELDVQLYHLYSNYIRQQFTLLPAGTRIATFHSPLNIIPHGFRLLYTSRNWTLRFWIKM